jgi:hypothetical protein
MLKWDKLYEQFTFAIYLSSCKKIAMKPNIKILYIQCFYMNDKQQNTSLLLRINF